MHRNRIWPVIFGTLIVGLGPAVSVQAAPRQRPAPKSEQLASRRDLCRAVPGPATAFLWTASRRSYGKRRNRLEPAGLCQRSICSSWQIAKRRIRTSASVTPRHRKRLSHLRSRARSQGLRPRKCRRRSSVTRRHRKQSCHPRAQRGFQVQPHDRRTAAHLPGSDQRR